MPKVRIALAVWLIVLAAPWSAAAGAPATQPAAAKAPPDVPKAAISAIYRLFPRRGQSRSEALANLDKLLQLGRQTEKKYAGAKNLASVQIPMMRVAYWLALAKRSSAYLNTMKQVSKRVLASSSPVKDKAVADQILLRADLKPPIGPSKVKDVPARIRAYVAKYSETDAAAGTLLYALTLAAELRQAELRDELIKQLVDKHLDAPGVRSQLRRRFGMHPDVGKPFQAELTRLDGTKLRLPEDLLGKVVVVDFWAVWCTPCVEEVPKMRRIYAKYKGKGVEFVGISLDKNRRKLTDFIRVERLVWIHTCSFKGWDDPTVQRYGVGGIPDMWVVGKDGMVVSDQARDRLEHFIDVALKAPAPAKKP